MSKARVVKIVDKSNIIFTNWVQTKTWTKIERTSMHKIEEIEKALKLLDAYDGQLSKTARALGINRYTLRLWRDKRRTFNFKDEK